MPDTTAELSPEDIRPILQDCYDRKPDDLWMKEATWRKLTWCALRGENTLMIGPTGFGKTKAASDLARAYDMPFFKFPLGQAQDPMTTFIGTREADDGSTTFNPSLFVEAIQTENAVILLDEISRAPKDAWNILMAPLDPDKRYLKIEGARENREVPVDPSVTFVATANIGMEYTATSTMDLALLGRFEKVEMDIPDKAQEYRLLANQLFEDSVSSGYIESESIEALTKIAEQTRQACKGSGQATELNRMVSTRDLVQCCKKLRDGFTVHDVVETSIYTLYPNEGGANNPREFVKNVAESYLPEQERFQSGGENSGDLFPDNLMNNLD